MAFPPTPADHSAPRMPRAKNRKVKGSYGPRRRTLSAAHRLLATRCQRYADTRALRSVHEGATPVSSEFDSDSERTIPRDEILTDPKSLTILGWTELARRRLLPITD